MFFRKSNEIKLLVSNHTDAVIACYDKFYQALEEVFSGCTPDVVGKYSKELRALESEADKIRRKIIRQLLEGGLVVDSRKSIMHVIEAVDQIADMAEDIIQELYIQKLDLPQMTHKNIKTMAQVTKNQLQLLVGIVNSIVDKYDGVEMTRITQEIENLESQVDKLQQELVAEIFDSSMTLAEKMQLREIVNMTGHIADIIEDISDEVEIIMLARKV